MDVKGKKVIVVGLARSGVGAANLLHRLGATVTVTDKKKSGELGQYIRELLPGIQCALGGHEPELFEGADLVVVSPGVPHTIGPLKAAAARGIRIIGELELAWRFLGKTTFLAVTGTNGKSTTTSLLDAMLRNGGATTILGGNIGNALTSELFGHEGDARAADFVVAEVSSFQLDTVDSFRPHAAAILNITPDHMDRYASISDYIDSKCRIFLNQDENDCLVVNGDDPMTAEIIKRIESRSPSTRRPAVYFFSRKGEVRGAYYKNELIHFNMPGYPLFSLHPSEFRIKGVHNMENAMAASIMALLSGCGQDAVARTLSEFPGLEHRLEFVREIDGVGFINDSKGTNVGAVIKSLESFNGAVVLIAGGRDKDGDFSELIPLVRDKVKALILIGEAGDKIRKALGGSTRIIMEDSLVNAVSRAREIASPGDTVLLSPACASFDMFRDFEDRGRQFKEIVAGI